MAKILIDDGDKIINCSECIELTVANDLNVYKTVAHVGRTYTIATRFGAEITGSLIGCNFAKDEGEQDSLLLLVDGETRRVSIHDIDLMQRKY